MPLADIIGEVLKVKAGTVYVEGANPRHAHEWRVFENVDLPDDTTSSWASSTSSPTVWSIPRASPTADPLGRIIGKQRLIAGTDCGFDTFIRFSQVDPAVAWLKLQSMVEGAKLASAAL